MLKTSVYPVDQLEPGMKLASTVVSPGGQTILTAGILLDETHIEFLKRRGIRKVQIIGSEFGPADSAAYEATLGKISSVSVETDTAALDSLDSSTVDPSGPMVVLNQMPSDNPPKDAPTRKEVDIREIELTQKAWQASRGARSKKLEEKHGESFKRVTKALGEPTSLTSNKAFQPAKLFAEAAKDLTENLYLEKKLSEDTMNVLTKNIMTEMISRQGMATLLNRAQAAGQYLLAHMVNVSVYSMYLAIQMELSSQEIQDTSIGGLLADIGMLSLPEPFWIQGRDLDKRERSVLERHPEASRKMILESPGANEAWAKIAYEHHERLDGSGYPKKIKTPNIGISSRIVQICDVYSAATADRAYRDAHLPDDAMRHIMGKPELFDRSIVEIFCQLVGFFPEGFIVLLSSGQQAVVVSTNPKNIFRPTVRLRKDRNGRPLMPTEQIMVDLSDRPDLRIVKILEDDTVRWV